MGHENKIWVKSFNLFIYPPNPSNSIIKVRNFLRGSSKSNKQPKRFSVSFLGFGVDH
jgi:hypothetical protein